MEKRNTYNAYKLTLLVGVLLYISFSVYNMVSIRFDYETQTVIEFVEVDHEEHTEEIDFESQDEIMTLYVVTAAKEKLQDHILSDKQIILYVSSYVEQHTPPPKFSC